MRGRRLAIVMKVPVRPTPAEQPTRMGEGLAEEDREVLSASISFVKLTRCVVSEGMPAKSKTESAGARRWIRSPDGAKRSTRDAP